MENEVKVLRQWGVEGLEGGQTLLILYTYVVTDKKAYFCIGYLDKRLSNEDAIKKIVVSGLKIQENDILNLLGIIVDIIKKFKFSNKENVNK